MTREVDPKPGHAVANFCDRALMCDFEPCALIDGTSQPDRGNPPVLLPREAHEVPEAGPALTRKAFDQQVAPVALDGDGNFSNLRHRCTRQRNRNLGLTAARKRGAVT